MNAARKQWRTVRHPLRLGLRGWRHGPRSLTSPRGTVFVTRLTPGGMVARRRMEFELMAE